MIQRILGRLRKVLILIAGRQERLPQSQSAECRRPKPDRNTKCPRIHRQNTLSVASSLTANTYAGPAIGVDYSRNSCTQPHRCISISGSIWARLGGRSHGNLGPPLSYWSVGSSAAGGVEIFLSPAVAELSQPWQQERWTHRVIAVNLGDYRLINIYAPNTHADRELFFSICNGGRGNSTT